jgi:site-specific DNA recombinase
MMSRPVATCARLRCAIYTRKSTEEGLEQDFNSLDAQREAGEAYIASQRHEGWAAMPDRYDDGGYTGANTDRPALQRLLADIEAGKVDVVVLYKIDRLSRSLLDFAKLMEVFERKKVTFVAVTQPFNTSTSMGRLLLNVLLSFAQFEREMIAERTRDKMSAARRRGKWIGGRAPLGYDVVGGRLVRNEEEAKVVASIFAMYVAESSFLRVAELANDRGWRMKSWTTRAGEHRPGGPWDKQGVRRVLTSVVYIGMVEYAGTRYPGEHQGIIDTAIFEKVAAIIESRRHVHATDVRNAHGFLLRGLIRCRQCHSVMTSSSTYKKKGGVYRYYACTLAKRRGRGECPVRSVSAEMIENFVAKQIHGLGQSPALIEGVVEAVATAEQDIDELAKDERRLGVEYEQLRAEAKRLLALLAEQSSDGQFVRERLAEIDERANHISIRLAQLRNELVAAANGAFNREHITAALGMFVPVWDNLDTREQARILHLLIEEVDFCGVEREMVLKLRPVGMRLLAREAGVGEEAMGA